VLEKLLNWRLSGASAGCQMDRSNLDLPRLTSNPSVTCLCQRPGQKPPGLLVRLRHKHPFALLRELVPYRRSGPGQAPASP